jgi:hypothetical protein
VAHFYVMEIFMRVRKIALSDFSFIMSVRLSACNNSAPTGRIFMKYDICLCLSVEKIQVSVKSDKNNGHITYITRRHI